MQRVKMQNFSVAAYQCHIAHVWLVTSFRLICVEPFMSKDRTCRCSGSPSGTWFQGQASNRGSVTASLALRMKVTAFICLLISPRPLYDPQR